MRHTVIALLLTCAPVWADVSQAVENTVLPGLSGFSVATALLAAVDDCSSPDLRPAFHGAFDAWMAVSHLRIGPFEDEGRALAIAFWPDPKAMGRKAMLGVLAAAPPADITAAFVADQSVAMRGLAGLERLLFAPDAPTGGAACALVLALADDLARLAAEAEAGWRDGFAAALVAPGPGQRFLSQAEARQAMLTLLAAGLEFTSDQRLGRPLGTFDRPAPEKAEAIAAGRSLRNVRLSLQALRALAVELAPGATATPAAFDRAIALADRLGDPVFAGVADPQGRLKVEILRQAVDAVRATAVSELAPALGVDLGFNSQDGD